MSFTPIRRLKVADQLAERVRGAILGGSYTPGQSLPSERDLAEQFAVNRSTVREALQRLEAWGLVELRHGGSTRVRDFLVDAGFQLLPYLVAPGGQPDPTLLADLLELRVMLLGWTARRAAEVGGGGGRTREGGLARLDAALGALRTATTAEVLQEQDYAFFLAMVDLAGNRVLGLLATAIQAVYLENRALFALLYQPDHFDLADHEAARAAIAAGNGDAAAAAMERAARAVLARFRGGS